MDSDTDHVVVNLKLEDMINNYNTWNHLIVCKQISTISYYCYLQTSHLKSKSEIYDKLILLIMYVYLNI